MRFCDPVYLFSAVLVQRPRRLREILRIAGGPRYLAGKLFTGSFYARLGANLK